ncbi:hypothetical protein J4427_03715 [Candidatus Woesearchaeota archaeon]|nr:hypothetical protein [Candidatus Woesearchaeota archaeon]
MGLKKIIAATTLALGLLIPRASDSQEFFKKHTIRYTGEGYKVTFNNKNYAAMGCYSALDRANGWCIVDEERNYITDPGLYSNLAFMAEVERDLNLLSSTVDSSKKTFDKALKLQLGVDVSKFALENLSSIEGPLIMSVVTGGSSLSKVAQIQTIRTAYKQQQEKVFSNIKEEFNRKYLNEIKQLSQDLMDGKITESQLKEKEKELEQKIRNAFDNSYEFQLKLASTELAKAQRLKQKPNKTYSEYELLWGYTRNGLARGFMATKALNMINRSNTLENNFKLAASKMIEGAGLESVLEISVDNPDFEKISEEAEKEFYRFYNSLDKQKSYWDANDVNSNASKIIPVVNYLQDRKEMIDNAKKQREEKTKQSEKQPQRTEPIKPIARKTPVTAKKSNQEPKKAIVQDEEGEGGRYTYVQQKENFDDQVSLLDNASQVWTSNDRKKEFFKYILGQLWTEQISNFDSDGNSRYEYYEGKLNDFYKSNDLKMLKPLDYYNCDLSIKLTRGDPSDINSSWTVTVSCNLDRDNELEVWTIDDNTKHVTQLQDDNLFGVK